MYRCMKCLHLPKDDFIGFLMRGSRGSHTSDCCTFCGAASTHDNGSCIVIVQCGDDDSVVCIVFQAVIFASRFWRPWVMANNVHKSEDKAQKAGCHERVFAGPRGPTVQALNSSGRLDQA